MSKEFKSTGEARDFGGTLGSHYESNNWIICIWEKCSGNLLQGSLENMNDDRFHFTLENDYLSYARVLESDYDGLGKRYDEYDKLVPQYVLKKIKEISQRA